MKAIFFLSYWVAAILSANASEAGDVWTIPINSDTYAIRFIPSGQPACGVLHWMDKALLPDRSLKTDKLNPNPELRARPLLGVTLIGDLKPRTAGATKAFSGSIYIPDPGLVCPVNIVFDAPSTDRAEVSIPYSLTELKCSSVRLLYGTLQLSRATAPMPPPVSKQDRCDFRR